MIQRQLGRGEISVYEIGGSLDDGVVELVEHLLRIGATNEEETTEVDLSFARGIPPRRAGNIPLDRTQRLFLAVAKSVEPTNVAPDQVQRQVLGIAEGRLLERLEGLLILSPRHLRPDLQRVPVLTAGPALESLRGLLLTLFVAPGAEEAGRFLQIVGPSRGEAHRRPTTPDDGPPKESRTFPPRVIVRRMARSIYRCDHWPAPRRCSQML